MEPSPVAFHTFYLEAFGFAISLLFCALFSFLETSITALRLFKLKEIASKSTKYHGLLKTLEQYPHKVLITILIANNLASVTAAALSTNLTDSLFEYIGLSGGFAFSLGIGICTMFILIFGEVIPKNIAKIHGEVMFPSVMWITNIVYYTLYPFVNFFVGLSNLVLYFIGSKADEAETMVSEREIRFLIDYISEKGLMESEKTEMLRSIFELGNKDVREIMVPSVDIIMVSADLSIKNALDVFSKYQFSRLPLYKDSPDNVIGMIHQKDLFFLLSRNEEKELMDIARPIMFVPESMKINQLLREFRSQGMHIAMVLNEFGSITGLVTLEDVLEEIVGEISDEYEQTSQEITILEDGNYLVDAAIDLDELAQELEIQFVVENAITLGGFLTEKLQHVPRKGERILYHGYYFQVQRATHKRVYQVLIYKEHKEVQ
jgi:putative hemolysin